ncbi:MAG: DnaB-like helicase C-terminal domain-containing protein, partial [Beijerinckiaceae bacterium]|nr:DnaB-like helicase C-terminal domain-containing protein [Beijerinckiaceae bacterium]
MDEADRQAVNAAIEKMKGFPLYIDESPAKSADEIKSACHEFISRHGKLGLIVIDDLQSIGSSNPNEDGAERYERVMSSLKRLASETDTPVILLSRLSALLDERE